jgi:broad specificity phosphatase PhoE
MSQQFADTVAELGVQNLVFIRHANSLPIMDGGKRVEGPHDWKQRDQIRGLTPKGVAQCASSKDYLKDFRLKANLCSPARRAVDTAFYMSPKRETEANGSDIFLRMVEGLHPAGMSEECERLFEDMGYGPLRKFFEAEGGKAAFCDYAERVCAELAAKIGGPSFERDAPQGDTITMFGHAVFLNALVYVVGTAMGIAEDTEALLLDVDLGETEGIFINVAEKKISHLKIN